MRVIFMGTPDFAVPALHAVRAVHEVVCAYTQPPRPAGRGHHEQRSPVHEAAVAADIPVRTPARLKDPADQRAFADLGADVAVVAAYGLILPRAILAAPRLGCVNIHASLLPRWRGAAPIQRAILAGDSQSGITIMQMDEGLDTGAMLLQERVPITNSTTGASLHDALAALGARLIVEAFDGLAGARLVARPQPAEGVTIAPKLKRDEGRLQWSRPAAELERQVRAFDPWPGSWFEHDRERIKVLASAVAAADGGAPGTVLAGDGLRVACGDGALDLVRVQRAGRAAMSAAEFQRGHAIATGTVLR
jgi:methionyl-tRNA formyltransferase